MRKTLLPNDLEVDPCDLDRPRRAKHERDVRRSSFLKNGKPDRIRTGIKGSNDATTKTILTTRSFPMGADHTSRIPQRGECREAWD